MSLESRAAASDLLKELLSDPTPSASPVTFDSFKRLDCSAPTWEMPLPDGKTLQVAKLEEDPEMGYLYMLSVGENEITTAYFDGFGCDERAGDVIHTVRLYLSQNY